METTGVTRDNFSRQANHATDLGPALLGANTLLGVGNGLFTVPWAALRLDTVNK